MIIPILFSISLTLTTRSRRVFVWTVGISSGVICKMISYPTNADDITHIAIDFLFHDAFPACLCLNGVLWGVLCISLYHINKRWRSYQYDHRFPSLWRRVSGVFWGQVHPFLKELVKLGDGGCRENGTFTLYNVFLASPLLRDRYVYFIGSVGWSIS